MVEHRAKIMAAVVAALLAVVVIPPTQVHAADEDTIAAQQLAERHVPVVMLSARAGEEGVIEGLEAGADDYLTKPFSARELRARVQANLELERVRRTRDHAARNPGRLLAAAVLASRTASSTAAAKSAWPAPIVMRRRKKSAQRNSANAVGVFSNPPARRT